MSAESPVSPLPPVRREILVNADPFKAFAVFTEGIGRWWPLATLSVHGAGSTVAFVEGQIVERSPQGETAVWGTVTRWEPSAAVAFTWHPGRDPRRASKVEVTFAAADAGTLVTLAHSGWENFDEPATAREEYNNGWLKVIGLYGEEVNAGNGIEDNAETWVALVHRPGPQAPNDTALFSDPRFADHVDFLNRMRSAGYLVAAGPLTDEPGAGMTILRLPGPDQLQRATQLATEEDASVAGGFFTVSVRPWRVVLQA